MSNFVQEFLKSQERLTKIKTESFVSPLSLSERRFYWRGLLEEGVIEIDVPLPKVVISDAFSFLFLAGFNCLFVKEYVEQFTPEIIKNTSSEITELYNKYKEGIITELDLSSQGMMYLEYALYLLINQDNAELREKVQEVNPEFNKLLEKIERKEVSNLIIKQFEDINLGYADCVFNLVPLMLDLYMYINRLKKVPVLKIDDEGVLKRAEKVARYL